MINKCLFIFFLFANVTYATVKAIIFDCDGTLIDNGIGYFLDWQHALKSQGYDLTSEQFWQFMNENNIVGSPQADAHILQYCCKLVGRDCMKELLEEKNKFSAQLHATYEFPPIEHTLNFLHGLAKEKVKLGIKLGLASGGSQAHIMRNLKRLNIDHYFDVIVSGSDDLIHIQDKEGTNKPKPYIYLHAAKSLGFFPNECVAIEDSVTGVSSAVSANCITVAVPNDQTIKQDLSKAHLKIESFRGITPSEFLKTIENLK